MNSKMKIMFSIKTWVVIYPSITMFNYFFSEPLSMLPLYARTFLLTITLVPWMIFVGLPIVDSLLRLVSTAAKKNE